MIEECGHGTLLAAEHPQESWNHFGMTWDQHIPPLIADFYEVYDYRHAASILRHEFPSECAELMNALIDSRISKKDITEKGENESNIPKRLFALLRPLGWVEDQLRSELSVDGKKVSKDTHKVDYLKGGVALDLEWNSNEQTYDRDLSAFREFHAFGKISVGVLVTRGVSRAKYGASATWMGKLITRLEAERSGGCPVLALGMKPAVIRDL